MKDRRLDATAISRREFLAASTATVLLASFPARSEENSFFANNTAQTDPRSNMQILSLSGSDWLLQPDTPANASAATLDSAKRLESASIPARVPGNIQADLESAHMLRPLWYGLGDPNLKDAAMQDWWYSKDFTLPEEFKNKRLRLILNGVDFEFEVWLNDRFLGARAGQFRRFVFDVGDIVRSGGQNRLKVKIGRMPAEISHCLSVSDGALSGMGTPNGFIDCYVHTRQVLQDLKSVSNFSYDWGFNIYTLGIWQDIWLEASGSSAIEWLQVETALSNNYREAAVTGRLEIDSQVPIDARASFRIRGQGSDQTVAVEKPLQAGSNAIEAQIPVHEPALWWPNGQGAQPLYELQVRLEEAKSGKELDTKTVRFGIREIRWQSTEGAPRDFINPYRLLVNGRAVRMMGSDVVPPDLLFGRIGERAPHLIRLAHAAGMNTLRMWGGGVTMPPEFYDLADELGIMLSHEFPLANSLPETGPVFLSNLRATVQSIVKQLRNHPSIVEWVGGNEMPWQQGTDHPALHVLERVCAEEDTRIFRATDPMQGSLHGPWWYQPRTHYEHYNAVLDSLSAEHPDLGVNTMNAMRYGEFGTQSPANLEVLERDIPPSSQWPLSDLLDPVLIRKNILQGAFIPLDWLMKPIIEGLFGPLDGLETLVEAGQFIGAEGLRYAYDELRRKGKRIGGLTSWDFNEPWPNGAGSYMVDYDGRTLMKYDFVRQALAPVSLTLRYNSILYDPALGLHADLWLTSDAPGTASNFIWEWLARDRRGDVLGAGKGAASIAPQDAVQLAQVHVTPAAQTALGPLFVELKLKRQDGEAVAERLHIFGADNTFVWPLDGLLRNRGADADDTSLISSRPRKTRVLWILDSSDGRYEDVAWNVRRFGIASTYIPATPEAFEKVAPDGAALARSYDVVWLGSGDFKKAESLASRIGAKNLSVLSQAVAAGVGLGIDGGWGGYADAGFQGTAIADVLPVTFVGLGNAQRRGRSEVKVTNPAHPLVAGKLGSSLPAISGYNLVKAKDDSDVVLKTADGDCLLTVRAHGKGRVAAYTSGIVGELGWVDDPAVRDYQGEDIDWGWSLQAWSGFPFFMARILLWLSQAPSDSVRQIELPEEGSRLVRPVRRTDLALRPRVAGMEKNEEILDLEIENQGKMTALFCEPHPMLEYRTDITVLNNHAAIPPGESRVISIRAAAKSGAGLSLSQTGWRISCWNADDIAMQPSEEVLLSLGRRDAMCKEYLGYRDRSQADISDIAAGVLVLKGNRPDSSSLPWLLHGESLQPQPGVRLHTVRFAFSSSGPMSMRASRLRIHTADQDNVNGPVIEVRINGRRFEQRLERGLGIQLSDPAHLAFPATAQFDFPAGALQRGANILDVRVSNEAWFTWDAMALLAI